MIDQLGGRKFIGFLVISILLFVLVLVGKLVVGDFTTFITANFAVYVAGNSITHLANSQQSKPVVPTVSTGAVV